MKEKLSIEIKNQIKLHKNGYGDIGSILKIILPKIIELETQIEKEQLSKDTLLNEQTHLSNLLYDKEEALQNIKKEFINVLIKEHIVILKLEKEITRTKKVNNILNLMTEVETEEILKKYTNKSWEELKGEIK
jgi:hypothetical protein